MAKVQKISAEVKSAIKRKSAYSLPDNPTESGLKACDIKKAFYTPIIDDKNSFSTELDRIVDEFNTVAGEVTKDVDFITRVDGDDYYGSEGLIYSFNGSTFTVSGNDKLEGEVSIPSSVFYQDKYCPVVAIAANAFNGSEITKAEIASSVESIGEKAFYASTLTSVKFYGSTSIGTNAFYAGCVAFSVPKEYLSAYESSLASYKKTLEGFDTVQNNAQNIANLAQNAAEQFEGKLDKITQPSDNTMVYAINTEGKQTTVGMSTFPKAFMLVRYGGGGRLKVAYPGETFDPNKDFNDNYDAIPKKYVDDSINGISLDYEIDENYILTLRLKKGEETINKVEINLPLESSIVEMKETVDEGGQPVLQLTLANGNVTTVALDDVFKLVNTNVEDLKAGLSGKVDNDTYNAKVADLEAGLSGKVDNDTYTAKVADLEAGLSAKVDNNIYNAKVADLETSLSEKVNITDFEKVKQELNTTDIRLTNIEARFSDDAVIDSTVAYEKAVPANALPYAEVQKIGGMSYRISPPYATFYDTGDGRLNADGSITVSSTSEEEQYISVSVGYTELKDKYFALSSECPYVRDVVLQLSLISQNEETGEFTVEDVTCHINNWIPEIDFSKYMSVDADLSFTVVANAGTVTFKPILTDTDDLVPKLLDTKVTELVSEGANLLTPGYVDGTKTENGVTFTENANGTITLDGTSTAKTDYILKNKFNMVNGVSYKASTDCTGAGVSIMFRYTKADGTLSYPTVITKTEGDNVQRLQLTIQSGFTFNNVVIQPMLNRGTTAAQAKPYRTAEVDIFVIPEAVRVLDGYGQSNPDNTNEYNYIDFVKKVFVAYGQVINNEWIAYDAPIETNISEYLTDYDKHKFIEVEAGGSIKAVNEYEYGAPSTIEYQTEVVE